jgi:hypothetical protein
MFALTSSYTDETKKVAAAATKAAFKNFKNAGAAIRKTAMELITKAKEPSEPGEPPHTRRGLFDRAMRFDADEFGATIGLAYSVAGEAGRPHEHGGEYKGQTFPQRPFMLPALIANLPRFVGGWQGTIGA